MIKTVKARGKGARLPDVTATLPEGRTDRDGAFLVGSRDGLLSRLDVPDSLSIAIVVVAYLSSDYITACFDSIRTHCPDAHVVVVDNSSEPATCSAVDDAQLLSLRLVDPHANIGYSRGVAMGLAASAPTDLVLILNPDARLVDDPRRLAPLLADFDVVSGLLSHSDQQPPDRARNARPRTTLGREFLAAIVGSRAYRGPRVEGEVIRVDQLDGAFLLMRRKWYLDHPLDPRFELYYEDVALCDEARSGRGCALSTRVSAVHVGGASSGKAPRLSYVALRVSRARYLRLRHPRSPRLLLFMPFALEACTRAAARVQDAPSARLQAVRLAYHELGSPGTVSVLSGDA